MAGSKPNTVSHPSGDQRFKLLEAAMKRHHYRQDALIEVLHSAQEHFGYLELDVLYFIAHHMKLPPSRVYGVATFYHFFTLKPKGKHTCIVCLGTACYVKGANQLLEAVEEATDLRPGETTGDENVSLLTARCLGTCGQAPVVVMDGKIEGPISSEQLVNQVKGWLAGGSKQPA